MITEVSIENFRKFKSLSINDLKRITLISGRNNVGKSSLIDALYLYMDHSNPNSFQILNSFRGISGLGAEGLWEPIFYNLETSTPIRISVTSNEKQGVLEYVRDNNYLPSNVKGVNDDVIVQFRALTRNTYSLRYSYVSGDYNEEGHFSLSETGILRDVKTSLDGNEILNMLPTQVKNDFYMRNFPYLLDGVGKLELSDQKNKLVNVLQQMDKTIDDLVTLSIKGIPQLFIRVSDKLLPLQYAGDGIIKLMNICLAVMESKNSLLLIDEIETGLHHSMYGKLWSILDTISKESNCQIIATTHSYEFISQVIDNLSNKDDFCFYRLGKHKDNITAYRYNYEILSSALKDEMEVR